MITLTRREREVIVFILLGLTSKEMAKRLTLGDRTIEGYRLNVLKKYAVNSTKQLLHKLWALA